LFFQDVVGERRRPRGSGMIVMKFGGTSVADAQPIVRVAAIVARQADDKIVVVSALAGVTDRLVQVGSLACAGRADAALGVLDGLVRRHHAIASALPDSPPSTSALSDFLDSVRHDVASLIARVAADRQAAPWALDAVLAAGELMASRLVAHALERLGVASTWVDPRQLLQTDDAHGRAAVDLAATAPRLERHVRPLLADGRVPVTGGFVGATLDGRTTTLGRGGSDVTAAVLGVGLDAAEVQIWTDVNGVLAADPRVVRDPRGVPRLSFGEAYDLAFFGAKVLHPDTLAVAAVRQVPVRVLNSRRPDAEGTLVGAPVGDRQPHPVAFACRRRVTVAMLTPRAGTAQSLLDDALGIVRRLSPRPVLAITLDGRVAAAFDDAMAAADFAAGVQDVAGVDVLRDLAVLAAVADAIGDAPGATDDMADGLDGLTIHALARTPSARAVLAILDDADLPTAMERLHDRYAPLSTPQASPDDPTMAGTPS
jgi:aspartate kinase